MGDKRIDFKFECFDNDRIQDLIDLYETCFGTRPEENYFKWKLLDNPGGPGEGFVAKDGDTIAAFHGVIPEDYIINGKKRTIYQAIDAMTHPNYRRMGLFVNLALHAYHWLFEKYGKAYVLATPGSTSHPGFVKMKFTDAIFIRFNFIHKHLFKARKLLSIKNNFKVSQISSFDENNSAYLERKSAPPKPISKYIDADFLNWRFVEAPLGKFKCLECRSGDENLGICVYKMESDSRCFIQFIDVADRTLYPKVMAAFTNHLFLETGASYVFAFEATDPALQSAFRHVGYIYNPLTKGPFSYRPPISLYANSNEIDGIPFYDISNWEVQAVLRDY